jgi:hypothetical protein
MQSWFTLGEERDEKIGRGIIAAIRAESPF